MVGPGLTVGRGGEAVWTLTTRLTWLYSPRVRELRRGLRTVTECTAVLVPEDADHAQLAPLLDALPPRASAFLQAYRAALTIKGAADLLGMSRRNHYNWIEKVPGYREVFELVDQEVSDTLEALLVERAVQGYREERLNGSGQLLETRVKHDATLLKMVLGARLPQKYGRDGRTESININIQQVCE